jgi:hypothetical protein
LFIIVYGYGISLLGTGPAECSTYIAMLFTQDGKARFHKGLFLHVRVRIGVGVYAYKRGDGRRIYVRGGDNAGPTDMMQRGNADAV